MARRRQQLIWLLPAVVAGLAGAAAACLPVRRPSVALEPDVSLASYRMVDVGPVKDESGWRFPEAYEITDSLRSRLVDRLRERGLVIAPRDSARGTGVLRIESRLTFFRSGGMGLMMEGPRTRCRLTSILSDGATGRRLGEIHAEQDDELPPFMVLMTCARMVADEIDRQVRGR
jgi:hypothetical protein